MRTILPHNFELNTTDDVTRDALNDAMRRALADSESRPSFLELHDDTHQRFVFFRDGQIYAAGMVRDGQFSGTPIREFLLGVDSMHFPRLAWYAIDNRTLHSILILLQKKPALRVQTSLVDLDEVLDRIEAEGKTCVVCASREGFLAILRYEKGHAALVCHEHRDDEKDAGPREDFLVRVYTVTADTPLTVGVYEDLLVSYAPDAKTIPPGFEGRFEELYLSKPPVLSLRFKDKEIDHWVFDRPRFSVGRTEDNDIVIDNLAVSRLHAVFEEEKGDYFIRDCDSLNGTVVNGKKVGRARLDDGDEVSIGKHMIAFRRQGGRSIPASETFPDFDQTMFISPGSAPPEAPASAPVDEHHSPRLIMKTEWGDRIIELDREQMTIGKDIEADIAIDGAFIARRHAEIVRRDDRVIIRQLGGLRRITVDGRRVREAELKNNDEIRIANEAFIYQE